MSTIWASNSIPRYLAKGIENISPQKNLPNSFLRVKFVAANKNWVKCVISRGMHKSTLVYIPTIEY